VFVSVGFNVFVVVEDDVAENGTRAIEEWELEDVDEREDIFSAIEGSGSSEIPSVIVAGFEDEFVVPG